MEIAGKTALITGGGSGIGAAIAVRLARAGARVMVAGRRAERLQATVEEIRRQGGTAEAQVADLADPAACTELVEQTVARFGPVDILVNNAGMLCHGRPIEAHTVEDWDRTVAVNLRAPFLLSCAVLPSMRERRQGFILMVSSDSGIYYFQNQAIYGLTKHGLNDLAQFILAEYGQYNIHAVALCPGLTDTEMGLSFSPAYRERVLATDAVAAWAEWIIAQPDNMKVGQPVVISPKRNPMRDA